MGHDLSIFHGVVFFFLLFLMHLAHHEACRFRALNNIDQIRMVQLLDWLAAASVCKAWKAKRKTMLYILMNE